ncbi:uncharacterized protein LOC127107841 [Lathyrus oleraceus]|uniref:Uncharacterized protein n=1 Tax=Pisum sativum TaxID=3888 RepID=A0A9D4ZWT1_PEA|nr:uncharacterized protein LOC127107841 [Pisum sativum]KAI5387426.1 hypothetical protein KIW84_073526 [Pisum sativum]
MGGGGSMRTVSKLAGIGVARSGFRGTPATYPVEHPVRNASRTSSPTRLSTQGAKGAEVKPLHTAVSGDLSDWEFADEGDLFMTGGEPTPRVVFGDVPTFKEAQEATAELKDAIDQIYLSSGSSQCEGSSPSQISVVSPPPKEIGTKSCLVEAISSPSVPKHAIHAFQLLSTSPEAQTVVQSIACDPNIWNAVMQNPAVTSFFESQLAAVESSNDAAFAGSETVETPKKEEGNAFDFMTILQNLKLTVTEMVSRMSNFFQNIFPTAEKDKSSADGGGANFMDYKNFMGGSFMGLAVMVIMVVLMKRA